MVTLSQIKTDLPNWPDEIIEHWLLPLANRGPDTGWPPPQDISSHTWGAILGWRPLSWWKGVTWTLEEQEVGFDALCGSTKQIAVRMLDEVKKGVAEDNSAARFSAAMSHLVRTGEFQTPPVAMKLEDGISIIDGNHRVTALVACEAAADDIQKNGGSVPSTKQKIWLGTHSNGEVPLDYPDWLD